MPAQTVIKLRRDTAANWTSTNPILAAGEAGFESDSNKLKIGDGSTAWASLGYAKISPSDIIGVTTTAAELNILDGVTATAAELNYSDGVTSAIQAQLDTKAKAGLENNFLLMGA